VQISGMTAKDQQAEKNNAIPFYIHTQYKYHHIFVEMQERALNSDHSEEI
jgi:hypothetical protein